MPSRPTTTLKGKLERNLFAYATAATASLGMAVLAQPSEAEVVYTPVHVNLGDLGVNSYEMDLDNDGNIELRLGVFSSCDRPGGDIGPRGSGSCLYSMGALAARNDVQFVESQHLNLTLALSRGVHIGPHKQFGRLGLMIFAFYPSYGTSVKGGYWINVRNRYLGLRFKVDGQLHYGWARLNAGIRSCGPRRFQITGTLTGYAYETEPDKPIAAGDIGTGASLGHLAQGAHPLSARRKPVAIGK